MKRTVPIVIAVVILIATAFRPSILHQGRIPFISFKENSADLDSLNIEVLNNLMPHIKEYSFFHLKIIGFNSKKEKKKLSYRRAEKVMKFMQRNGGDHFKFELVAEGSKSCGFNYELIKSRGEDSTRLEAILQNRIVSFLIMDFKE